MNSITEIVNALSQEQRIEAQQNAAKAVIASIGEKPKREHFQTRNFGKYPAWMFGLIVALVAIVLATSFIVSAMRLYHIGSNEFFKTIQDAASATTAGIAIVLSSEASAVLFTIALSVIGKSNVTRAVMVFMVFCSTMIALTGNYFVALHGYEQTAFSWLEAMLPPMFTIGAAFVLKEVMLQQLEQRHHDQVEFEKALDTYRKQTANPEDHDRFMPLYANALKDKVFEANKRRSWNGQKVAELMNTFTHQEWSVLVQREMNADVWYKPDTLPTQARAQEVARTPGFLAIAPLPANQHPEN